MRKPGETVRRNAICLVPMTMLCASLLHAQSAPATQHDPATPGLSTGAEIAVTYAAQCSIVTGLGNSFWLQGVAADASLPVYRMGSRELSLAVDLTFGHSGSTGGAGSPLDVVTTVAGPRFTWKASHVGKLQPAFFAEALFGVAHGFNSIFPEGSSAPGSANSFALIAGGGIGLPLTRWASVRLLQIDYVRSSLPNGGANVQNSFRIATGITLRFSDMHSRK